MGSHRSERDTLIGEWWFQDSLGFKTHLPTVKYGSAYMKTLMNLAAADGVLSHSERDWIVGLAAVSGLPQDVIEQLKKYQPGDFEDDENLFLDSNMAYVQNSRLSIVFYALRAASADGELHADEFRAIRILARQLDVTDEEIKGLCSLIEEEDKLRKKRASYLFPQGLDRVMAEYDDHSF